VRRRRRRKVVAPPRPTGGEVMLRWRPQQDGRADAELRMCLRESEREGKMVANSAKWWRRRVGRAEDDP
jgi:hypothetical protein